ncbi:MAG: IS66 family transposase, partial [Acidimicrobiales bacterium]
MSEQEAAGLLAENAKLQVENGVLRGQVAVLQGQVQQLQEQVSAARARVAEVEQGGQRRRKFGKPAKKRPEEPAKRRRMRAPEQNAGRPLDRPTAFARHQYEECPDCGYGLRGGSVWWQRQVVDLPPPAPLVVTEHTVVRRWCPACRQWCAPPRPAGVSLGQGRLGVGIASLVATLRTTLRLPLAQIQLYLETLHGLRLSTGGIVDLLRRVAQTSAPLVADFQAQAQASPILHGDETGWRENGEHGYVWVLTTPGPAPVCYFARDRSRAHAVLDHLLGDQFGGVLVSDFYGAYNSYPGTHQRCWAHLLRDLHDLKEEHPDRPAVLAWARAVRRLHDWAQGFLHGTDPPTPAQRQRAHDRLVAVSHRLGLR